MLKNSLTTLDGDILKSYNHHLAKCKNWRDMAHLKDWLENPHIWSEPMVSIETFMDDPDYLGLLEDDGTSAIYPKIREQAKNIVEGGYQQAAFVAGIGSGKTTLSEVLATYNAHHLLCLRKPHSYYSLAADKAISIINMGTSATQAKDNAFAGIKKFIGNSPFFQRHNPRILESRVYFKQKDILLLSGNSKSTTALGYNVFCAILDEAAFFLDTDEKNAAEEIYTALHRRIVSRFRTHGLLIMISSPNYEGDFIMRKREESLLYPDVIYSDQVATWRSKVYKDPTKLNPFYFNFRTGEVMDKPTKGLKVSLLADTEFDSNLPLWEIPGEFKSAFVQDPDKAKRDYAAVPSKSIAAFMPNTSKIAAMFTEDENPRQYNGTYKFLEPPLRTSYYIHVDLALNRNGKGDYAGLSMCHFDGYDEQEVDAEGEPRKKIVIDLAEKIGAGPTGEIEFEDVRNKIYRLRDMGYNIRLVTLDSFQSVDTMQKLRSKGIRSEYVSVDRTIEPYQTLKELIYTGNIKCHKMPELQEELSRLEVSKSRKVDHPPGFSKDVADAVCGAVYSCMKATGGKIGIASGPYFAKTDNKGRVKQGQVAFADPFSPAAQKAKADHYRRLQGFVDRGVF